MASICVKVNLGMLFVCVMDGPSQIFLCGHKFEVDHALSCKRGGFVIQRHNELRDFTASLLMEVCHNVALEPSLQRRISFIDLPILIPKQGLMSKPMDS